MLSLSPGPFLLLLLFLLLSLTISSEAKRGGNSSTLQTQRKGGLQLGGRGRNASTRAPPTEATTTPSSLLPEERVRLSVGMVVPYSMFQQRDYQRAIYNVINILEKKKGGVRDFFKRYTLYTDDVKLTMLPVAPSPRGG